MVKFATCLIGHPFLIARDFYYPHPQAYSFAYSWILFYFIEILVFIPKAAYLLREILSEKMKGKNFGSFDKLTMYMQKGDSKEEEKSE